MTCKLNEHTKSHIGNQCEMSNSRIHVFKQCIRGDMIWGGTIDWSAHLQTKLDKLDHIQRVNHTYLMRNISSIIKYDVKDNFATHLRKEPQFQHISIMQ